MATNYAKASYTEVIDLQTTAGKTSVIGIHTPQGRAPYDKLKGFFTQFRKFRYKGISRLTIAPASSLPVDPLGLTSEIGSTTQMDPRDTLNPILFKGCHGTSMSSILDKIFDANEYVNGDGVNVTGSNLDVVTPSMRKFEEDNVIPGVGYYKLLTDVTWRKYGVQSVINIKRMYPLVWRMARNLPINPSAGRPGGDSYVTNAGALVPGAGAQGGLTNPSTPGTAGVGNNQPAYKVADLPTVGLTGLREYAQEFTNGCSRLGWLPTVIPTQGQVSHNTISGLPKLFMGMFVMPPAYNTEQFMRMVIRHEFEFKEFTTSLGPMDRPPAVYTPQGDVTSAVVPDGYYNFIDYGDSKVFEGTTLDVLDGEARKVSDGVA